MTTYRMEEETHQLRVPVSDSEWTSGPKNAPVTLVEYLDYQCPNCQGAFPEVERLRKEEASRMRFVVRHFPLTSEHPRAMAAALAAEAAGKQGKFWEMYVMLFKNRGKLAEEDLRRYGEILGLDMARYEKDRHDKELEHHITQMKIQGARSGVNGTPTFFINGERYDGSATFEDLSAAVEAIAEEQEENGGAEEL